MYIITRSLPVCLDQIVHFDVYKLALDQVLSLEPPEAEFLKSREGISTWLGSLETFQSFRKWAKQIAHEMMRCIDDSPITYINWTKYVANNEVVINHICSVLEDVRRASEMEEMDYEDLISAIDNLTTTI